MPASRGARLALEARLKTVQAILAQLCEHATAKPRTVHEMRVATRRAGSALSVFRPCIKPQTWKRTRQALRRLRRAATQTRQCDVHLRMIREMVDQAAPDRAEALRQITSYLQDERRRASRAVLREANRFAKDRFRTIQHKALARIQKSGRSTVADVAHTALELHVRHFAELAKCDLSDLRNLHDFRLTGKKIRYAVELVPQCMTGDPAALAQRLEQFQDQLGAINDLAELALRLERLARETDHGRSDHPETPLHLALGSVIEELWRRERHVHESFLTEWQTGTWTDLMQHLQQALGHVEVAAPVHEPSPPPANEESQVVVSQEMALPETVPTETDTCVEPIAHATTEVRTETVAARDERNNQVRTRRIAAIDVGTNSVRLVIAEVSPEGDLRLIDDEKNVTRLGRGIIRTGRLSEEAMQHTVQAILRYRQIAEGRGVERMRAVATSAVREASNGPAFAEQVLQETGVALEIIQPQTEARLAFRSVSQSFDLRSTRTAVVDIGGGSTEIILGSGDLIEQIYAIPLGAITLTEQFGLQDDLSTKRYRAMRDLIKRTVKSIVQRPPFVPHMLIGTGGTFTTLGAMSIHRGMSTEESDVLPFSVRGYELQRSELKHILDHLRHIPMAERLRMPGLSAERADIIVAGLAVIDCVLKHLQVNTIRVHDQGIRNGLLRTMADELVLPHVGSEVEPSRPAPDRMRSVRQFAASCKYEQPHAEHVSALSLQIFDQMVSQTKAVPMMATLSPTEGDDAAGDWTTPECRELLHAAALLHDVGYFINYASHHKHTYHLIMHSDLAWFTHRQRELIANIARYHRGAGPKKRHANFAALNKNDRAIVAHLASILRLAVGLDRSHTHNVRSVSLRLHDGLALMQLVTANDASVDVWGAVRKCRMFEKAFGVRLRIISTPQPSKQATTEVATQPARTLPTIEPALTQPAHGTL